MFIADAGQGLFENVFIVYRGGAYPWNIREGTHCFDPANNARPKSGPCPTVAADGRPLIGPVVEIGHDMGNTIIGGVLYRGSGVPALKDLYVFGTWSDDSRGAGNGTLLASAPPAGRGPAALPADAASLTPAGNAMWTTHLLRVANNGNGRINAFVRDLSETDDHEILVLTSQVTGPAPSGQGTGEVWMVVPADTPGLSATTVKTAPAAVTTPATAPAAGGQDVALTLTVRNTAFDRTSLTVPAGARVALSFTNAESMPHNFALYTDSSASTEIFIGDTVRGPATVTYRFTAPAAPGTYFFRCDIHPATMTGTFVVT